MKKHAKTTGHEANMNQYLWALTFFQPRSSSITNRTCADSEVTPSSYNTSANSCPTSTSPDPIRSLFKTTWSTKSEIILAFYCISHGYSDNSTQHFGYFLHAVYPTSPEAYDFKMGPIELMYVTNFGLYSYYKNLLIDDLTKTLFIVVTFDKSLNEALQESQIDFILTFWYNVAKS